MHVAGFVEGVVECERTLEVDGSLPGDTALEVFKQQGTVVGMAGYLWFPTTAAKHGASSIIILIWNSLGITT